MIPMVNLKAEYADIKDEIEQSLHSVLDSAAFILGPNVQAFEREAASYLGVKHCIGVASGTDALHLALKAAGIGPGDEVITTAFTFIATAEAICYVGAKPVFVDIEADTFNISAKAIERAITEKTKAVMPVHLFGQPTDIPAIKKICDRYQLQIIEDCAQSFGASIDGQKTGSLGLAGGFSFFPSKNLGCFGDGGLVTTSSDELADQVKMLRNHGSKVRYYHDVIGYNSRLDEMQAAILRVKLKRIDESNKKRRWCARLYSELMADLPVKTPFEDGVGSHVYHQYTLLSKQRDQIIKNLQSKQIGCAVYYPVPLHRQKAFIDQDKKIHLPFTEQVAEQCFSLPICPAIKENEIQTIVDVINQTLTD